MQVRSVVAFFTLLECLDPSADDPVCYDDPREAVSFDVERAAAVRASAAWRRASDEPSPRRPSQVPRQPYPDRFEAMVDDTDFVLQHLSGEMLALRSTDVHVPRPREAGRFELASLGATVCESYEGGRTCRLAEGTLEVRRDDDAAVDVTVDVVSPRPRTEDAAMDARVRIAKRTWTERRCISKSTGGGGCGCDGWGAGLSGPM